MSESMLLSARVSPYLAQRLAALASTTRRSKSFLAAQAIEEFVNVQEWQVAAIQEGLAAVDRGEVVSHSQALAILDTWGVREKD